MPTNLFTTRQLIQALGAMDRPTAALRDRFFKQRHFSTTEEIAFDKLKRRRKMAPYVSPHVPGVARELRGRQVQTFTAPYLKPKAAIKPDVALVRAHGEDFGAPLTPEQRYNETVVQTLQDQNDEITRREEAQCFEVLTSGQVVVSGDKADAQTVDYARDAALTTTLSGGSRWGETGVDIRANLRAWSTTVAQKSGGTVTQVIMGAAASEILTGDADIKDILDNRRQATGQMELGPQNVGADDNPMVYLGSLGQFDFHIYNGSYDDEDGNNAMYLDENGVILIAPNAFQGMMAYGAIQDRKALQSLSRFPKMWEQDDPSVEFLMTQAAPLAVPSDINATMYVEVR
jgi:hypothetical protein